MFRLRELERKDLTVINQWRNDAELIYLLGTPYRYINLNVDIKCFESYIGNHGSAIRCVITNTESDEIFGLVSLVSINYISQSAELHIIVSDKNNQGQSIESFAVQEMLRHAFYNMNLQRVEMTVLEDNKHAKHLYEKCGFVYEGRKRDAMLKNGKLVDILMYSVLKQEFSEEEKRPLVIKDFCIDEVKSIYELRYIMRYCDTAFTEPVHERAIYNEITDKLSKNAKVLVAYAKDILGYNAFYCNNSNTKTAYISLIAVDKSKQNMHIGRSLLKSCEDICMNHGMIYLDLEVRKDNIQAKSFYEKNGFHIIDEREHSHIMRKELI